MTDVYFVFTIMRHLTTGIHSEKCVVKRFRRHANVVECTYTNLDSTVHRVRKRLYPFFLFFFLGAQCAESGVSCTDCY